ncbi:MAG: sigma-70 family RNA polymerase sigma factor [Planctomycetota bacterium]
MTQESKELLSRFARGDDSALGRLVELESPRLLRQIEARMPAQLKRRVGASDVLQLTAIDLLRVRERFQNLGLPAFRKMLSAMADLSLAKVLEQQRAQKRSIDREARGRAAPDTSASGGDLLDQVPGQHSTPSKELQRNERKGALRRAYAQLSADDREVIRLVDYQSLSFADAAGALGINEEAARRRHSRAVERLRTHMRERAE